MCDNSSNGHGSDADRGAAARGAGQGSGISGIFGRPTDARTPSGRNGHKMTGLGLTSLITRDLARRLADRRVT